MRAVRGAALRRRWSPLALGLLGHWRRGDRLWFPSRGPQEGSSTWAVACFPRLRVLEREGPTSGPPPPPPRLPPVHAPGTAEGRVWQAGGSVDDWKKDPLLHGERERGATAIRRGGRGPRCSAAADGGKHWPPKRHWLGTSPTCPRAPRGAGSEEGGVPDRHPADTGTRTGSQAGSLEACALAPEPL